MKWKFLILFTALSISCYGQKQDSVICLPKSDVVILANKVKLLRDSLRYKGDIIFGQDTLLNSYRKRTQLSDEQLFISQKTISTLEEENKSLRKTIDLMTPKWYDNKWLWFSGGAVVVTLVKVILR